MAACNFFEKRAYLGTIQCAHTKQGGSEMGWYSLDPRQAVRAVHRMKEGQLLQVVYQSRCAEARRAALLRLNDQDLYRVFAKDDPAPLVRRRIVREITDTDTVRKIAENDKDASVREAAEKRLSELCCVLQESGTLS